MIHQLSVLNQNLYQTKNKARKPCLYYYTGGRGRTGTSLRTLDFEFGSCGFIRIKTSQTSIIRISFYRKNAKIFYF